MKKFRKIKITLRKKVKLPLWILISMLLYTGLAGAFMDNFVMKNKYTWLSEQMNLQKQDPEQLVKEITQKVIPASGYETSIIWGDLGKQLVEVGAIDKQKYEETFPTNATGKQELELLDGYSSKKISINENNSRFLVNTLWALGLANKSKVLDEGPMKTGGYSPEKFASTGGWTLGAKPAMELYSRVELIPLSEEEQERVRQIAENVYRPCCGNHTAFPDCNHGMAALGYIELAVKNGLSDEQIYKDLLAFNSYWFPTTYVEMGVYFAQEGKEWDEVDPKLALSNDYSSAMGAQKIHKAVANVPGIKSQGGSCGT